MLNNRRRSHIRSWKKFGKLKKLYRSKYGQFIVQQVFINPVTGKKEDYIFHGEGDGVRILGLTKNKRIIVIREYQHAVDEIVVQLPTGGIKKSENLLSAAKREFIEETGYKPGKVIYLGESYSLPRNCPTREYSFLALDCKKSGNKKSSSTEQIEIIAVPLKRWVGMIMKGKIKQDVSVLATFRALPYLIEHYPYIIEASKPR